MMMRLSLAVFLLIMAIGEYGKNPTAILSEFHSRFRLFQTLRTLLCLFQTFQTLSCGETVMRHFDIQPALTFSKNTKVTLEWRYALHSCVGTVFSNKTTATLECC